MAAQPAKTIERQASVRKSDPTHLSSSIDETQLLPTAVWIVCVASSWAKGARQ
jgi:hypothetical protein